MKMLDLFSGIGGFHLAAEWVWGEELEVVAHCEIDPWATRLLKKHWPDVPIHDDITTLKGDSFGTVDLITGGFPCQPFSQCGKKQGKDDSRYLWPSMLRVIGEARPRWILGENVSGAISILREIKDGLENVGYQSELFDIPASSVGAKHHRRRIWILAYPKGIRWDKMEKGEQNRCARINSKSFGKVGGFSMDISSSLEWPHDKPCSGLNRRDDGLSTGMDRLRGLGNAIVPQCVVPFMQLIKQVEMERKEEAACKAVL